jgi:hypothetical protein
MGSPLKLDFVGISRDDWEKDPDPPGLVLFRQGQEIDWFEREALAGFKA